MAHPSDVEFLQFQLECCKWLDDELDVTRSDLEPMKRLSGVMECRYCVGDVIGAKHGIEDPKALREVQGSAEEQKKINRLERRAARSGKYLIAGDVELAA